MTIAQVQLANTFNQFRETTNLVIDEVNKLSDGTGTLVINTLQANSIVGLLSANAASFFNINASNIAFGTISNDRTTGNSANSASTIVLRDASGNFSTNTVTLTAVTGISPLLVSSNTVVANLNVDSVDGKDIGSLSAGAIVYANTSTLLVSGTVGSSGQALISGGSAAPTWQNVASSNGASSIVTRDANGSFSANVVNVSNLTTTSTSVVTNLNADFVDGKSFGTFGAAGGILFATSVDAANASVSGSSGQAVISGGSGAPTFQNVASSNGASSIVARDANGSFSANIITVNHVSGNGAFLSALNASNIATGTIANARTTASSANGANLIITRDANGSFSANAVSSVSFDGNGSLITNINATNIATGTIANARTTASSANGANLIITRDANGSFSANIITVNHVSGNGAFLSDLNASNIATGTITNARTTGTSSATASTLVLRDANGSFSANVVTVNHVSGNGAFLSALNASNIATGTITNARTTGTSSATADTLALRDTNASFSANVITGTHFSGNGAFLSALNASNIATGTIANARTTGTSSSTADTLALRDTNASFSANVITGTHFSGNGAFLSALNASNIATGTITNARTTASSANGANLIVTRDANGDFAANIVTVNHVSGNGAFLSALNASNIATGTIANARTTASSANGANLIVTRDANGDFAANIVTVNHVSGNGAFLSALNASNIATGTIANARTTGTSSATASTLVLRDTNASFSANVITGTHFSGNGAFLSDLNASNIATGTIANARTTGTSSATASTLVLRDANGSFSANIVTASLSGNATTATTLQNARNINGVSFNGSADITVTANTTQTLTRGTYLTGSDFNGGTATTWAVNAAAANGASSVVARDVDGSFAGNIITATSFSGSGASLNSLNATSISTGTIPNARTTGASANGSNTLVLRDANGSFSANAVTATTFSGSLDWSNVTNKPDPVITVTLTGDVTGTASATLADVASNTVTITTTVAANSVQLGTDTTGNYVAGLTQGNYILVTGTAGEGWSPTVAVDATSASTASKVVARDANGSFSANVITATLFSGSGASLTNIPNSATTATSVNSASTIVARDAAGSFAANVVTANSFTANSGIDFGANTSQLAGSLTTSSTSQTTLTSFSSTVFRSAKYFIQAANTTSFHALELTLIHDGANVFISQYGEVLNNSSLASFDASITSGTLSLLVTPSAATSTTFRFISNLIKI